MEHRLAVELGSEIRVGVRMHRAFRAPGRARGVQPERRIIAMRAGGTRHRRVGFDHGFKRDLAEIERGDRMRHDHLADLVITLGQSPLDRRQDIAAGQHGLGARMFEHVGVVVRGQQRIDCDRHDAGIDRAQKRRRPVGAVLHRQQHAFLALDAEIAQGGGDAADAILQIAVAQRPAVVDERRLRSAAAVERQEMRGKIECLRRHRHVRRGLLRDLIHVPPPEASTLPLAIPALAGGY